MAGLSLTVLATIFVVSASVVWLAGVAVSRTTDVLSRRLGWGNATGGLVALALVTNLPEIAIVMTGAVRGDLSLAIGNILGGIAIQTVVLALLDLFGPRGKGPLTFRAASMTLVLEGVLVVAILALVVAGSQLPADAMLWRISPVALLIVVLWIVGVRFIARRGDKLPWSAPGSDSAPAPVARSATRPSRHEGDGPRRSTARVAVVFGAAALATLLAGVLLERSSSAIADDLGISGAVFGATILALATSLPELSTGITAVRMGDDEMAVSDIFGGNAFLPVLFFPAALITGTAVLPQAQPADLYLTAVGIVLTTIYLAGIVIRSRRRVLGMGVDSVLVVATYLVAVGGLALV